LVYPAAPAARGGHSDVLLLVHGTDLAHANVRCPKGVPAGEIEAVGMGSSKLLVKPDNTDAMKAKNRRYEIQVKI